MAILAKNPANAPFALALSSNLGSSISYEIRTDSNPGLDYETQATYELTVEVRNTAGNTEQTTLTISVQDEEEAPWFYNLPNGIQLGIPEDIGGGVSIYQLKGDDQDSGDTLSYSVSGGTGSAKFSVEYNTGVIETVANPGFNFESGTTSYSLSVQVSDGTGTTPDTGTIQITIIDVNDNAPVFSSSYTGTNHVDEEANIGTTVIDLDASDADNGDTVRFEFVNSESDFIIDAGTGAIKTSNVLDYDDVSQTTSWSIPVRVYDDDRTHSSTVTISINLKDLNDNEPTCDPAVYEQVLSENANVDDLVASITCSDADRSSPNNAITITMTSGDASKFKYTSNGIVQVKSTLDYDDNTLANNGHRYELVFDVVDGGTNPSSLTGTATVIVQVTDVNDNLPQFSQTTYTTDVDENENIGHVVITVLATDADWPFDSVSYEIIGGDDASLPKFTIEPITGVIKLRNLLDHESRSSYTLTIRVTDGHPTSPSTATASVSITVNDINDESPYFNPYIVSVTLAENSASAGVDVTSLTCFDDDSPNSEIVYDIIAGSLEAIRGFLEVLGSLEAIRGFLEVLRSLEAIRGFLEVLGSLEAIRDFLEVLGSLEAIRSFLEVLGSLEANCGFESFSKDSKPQLASRLSNTAGKFTLPVTTGTLNPSVRLATSIDYDGATEPQSYTITVRARDENGVGLSGTAIIQIEITGINEFTPSYIAPDPNPVSIQEQLTVGTSVVTVSASDDDRGSDGDVSYYLVSGDTDNSFETDSSSGVVRIKKEIDYDTMGSNKYYALVLRAVDGGSPANSATQTVTVTITDTNDIAPTCSVYLYTVKVAEDTVANTKFVTLDCEDEDSSNYGDLVYTISPSVTEFDVDQSDGGVKIKSGQSLDYESGTQEYSLNVVVRDNDPTEANRLTTTVLVTVKVGAVNEHYPSFTSSSDVTVNINEDSAVGYQVTTMSATDADENDHIHGIVTHRINSPAGPPFGIDASTGVIKVISQLDYETTNTYVLLIVAEDGGGLESTGTVTVSIDDVNDNHPACSPTSYSGSIEESFALNSQVLKLTCTDSDSNAHGTVMFDLVQTPSNKFAISSTGSLTLSSAVDFDSV
ncbi:cadherin-23-like [Glandiceps talaboti]